MNHFAIRLPAMAIFSLALIAVPAMRPAFASAGDPPVASGGKEKPVASGGKRKRKPSKKRDPASINASSAPPTALPEVEISRQGAGSSGG